MDLERPVRDIEGAGTEMQRARLRVILSGQPAQEMAGWMAARQNPDGGFALGLEPGQPSSIDSTLHGLWRLDGLGLLGGELAGRALLYLQDRQLPDGGWDEERGLAAEVLPPWIELGQPATRMYLSAYAAYWIGLAAGCDRPVFQRALPFLMIRQEAGGRLPGYVHNTWIAAAVFWLAGEFRAASRAIDALDCRAPQDWTDSQMAWALNCLGSAGLDREHPFIERCLEALIEKGKAGQPWSAEDGEEGQVDTDLEVLAALKRFGVV